MLMMVLCDREGRVYDVWITFGSVHEVRAFRERKKRSLWFRGRVEICVLMGGRSSEWEISLKCGQAILSALQELGHEAIALDLYHYLLEEFHIWHKTHGMEKSGIDFLPCC